MKWERARQSDNIEDRRGRGMGARAGGVGIGGIAIAMIVGWFMGINPAEILSLLAGQQGQSGASGPVASSPEEEAARANDPRRKFVAADPDFDRLDTVYGAGSRWKPAPAATGA
jgi:hypothetical protein